MGMRADKLQTADSQNSRKGLVEKVLSQSPAWNQMMHDRHLFGQMQDKYRNADKWKDKSQRMDNQKSEKGPVEKMIVPLSSASSRVMHNRHLVG